MKKMKGRSKKTKKIINGKTYLYWGGFESKETAKELAEGLRLEDYKSVRVFEGVSDPRPTRPWPVKVWDIYVWGPKSPRAIRRKNERK